MENRLFLLDEPEFNWDAILNEDMGKKFAEDAKKINNRQFTLVGPDTFKAFELNMFEWVTEDESGQMVPSTLAIELSNLRKAVSADEKEEAQIQVSSMKSDIDSDDHAITLEGARPQQGAGALYVEEAIEAYAEDTVDAIAKAAISYKQVIELTGDVDGTNDTFRIKNVLDIVADDAKGFVNGVREPYTLIESAGYIVGITFDEAPALHSEVILGGDILTAGPDERIKAMKEKVASLEATETANVSAHDTFKAAMQELLQEIESVKAANEASIAKEVDVRTSANADFDNASSDLAAAENPADIRKALKDAEAAHTVLFRSANEHKMALNSSKVYGLYAIADVKTGLEKSEEDRKNGSEDSNARVLILNEEMAKLSKAVDTVIGGPEA